MKIKFDTADQSPTEAVAIVQMLIALHAKSPTMGEYLATLAGQMQPQERRAVGTLEVKLDAAEAQALFQDEMSRLIAEQGEQQPAEQGEQTWIDPDAAFPPPPVSPPEAGVPFVHAPSATASESVALPDEPAAAVTDTATLTTPSEAVDSAGMPWDERIHAGTKTAKKDGTWKAKPGVDKDTLAEVEAELKAARPLVPAAATPPPPPAPAPVAAPPPPPVASATTAPADIPAPPVSSPAASAPPPPPPPAAPAATVTEPAPSTGTPISDPAAVSAPPAPPVPAPTPPIGSSEAAAPVRFAMAVKATTEAQAAGKLTADEALAALRHYLPEAASLAVMLAGEATVPGTIAGYHAWVEQTVAARS